MTAYRPPDFKERAALSRQARQRAVDQLRARPAPSEAELAERKAAALKRAEAEAEQRARRAEAQAEQKAQRAEAKQAAADARAQAAEAAARSAEKARVPVKTE